MNAAARGAVTVLLAFFAFPATAQFAIFPSQPKTGETVRIQIPGGSLGLDLSNWDYRANRVTMSGNRITVGIVKLAGMIVNGGPEPSPPVDLPMGQFPEGTYQVDVRVEAPDRTVISNVGSASFSVAPKASGDPLWNLTDLWWDPSESGWGINIIQHPTGVVFATWFVYAADGRATWYVVPDARPIAVGVAFRGTVYRTTGPPFCTDTSGPCPGQPFDPASVTRVAVGQAVIGFHTGDYDRATLSMTIDGKSLGKNLRRQSF